MPRKSSITLQLVGFVLLLAGCKGPTGEGPAERVQYIGSSTVGVFIREADLIYHPISFDVSTAPESEGGERAILAGETDLAGIATRPMAEPLPAGIRATMIGRDAIAVIVAPTNPVRNLSLEQLRDVFTGTITNWREFGGPNLEIRPFIVAEESATRVEFRNSVLGSTDYAGCETVRPDVEIIHQVSKTPGGIGQISFSFLNGTGDVATLSIGGEAPAVTNFTYPIGRPLFLLWREANPTVRKFVDWVLSDAGQNVVMNHFVGVYVVGSIRTSEEQERTGSLLIRTDTFQVYDGGINYYPHLPYVIFTRHGDELRRVRNHRGNNDEMPMRVQLPPGVYLIRAESGRDDRLEFFVRIEADKLTEVDVEDIRISRN